MKERLQLKIRKSSAIITAWAVVALFISIYDYLAHNYDVCEAMGADCTFINSLRYNLIGALIGAVLAAWVLVFIIDEKLRDKPYSYTALVILVAYTLAFWLVTLIMGLMMVNNLATGSGLPLEAANKLKYFMQHPVHIKNLLIWSVITILTHLALQFNNKFGEGLLWSMITGRFQTPKQEERIFMLVDINSSTNIAEKLGDEKYHMFLREFFSDITAPILKNKGKVYQYVGDEVIISWKRKEGIEDNHCVNCFFDMKQEITLQEKKYLDKYGVFPTFKAGLHWGKVTMGEVGVLKRELTYSGDVLNTASRIQSKCREFNVDFIASEDIINELPATDSFITRMLGSIRLRGKEKDIILQNIIPV